MKSSKYLLVFVTSHDAKTTQKILKTLLKEKIISSAQISQRIKSYYWWNNKIEKKTETLITMTTLEKNFKILKEQIGLLHPYKVPQIISVSIFNANKDYQKWIRQYCN
ncbi:MAG: divalent-cation tolerance protein CutA [Endomicrobium sp.]|jgi:periplasmic divalent cation tolerance protein|nr:divalent-cation tolerance protein CutA [Endomicrobium sp.]